jgi:hypothetical protein
MAGRWKHGWVPLDTTAAIEKAHGSKSGASKALTAGKRAAPSSPRTAPKMINPGGRNMQDLSGPKGIKGSSGIVDLGKLPPGFGKPSRRSR